MGFARFFAEMNIIMSNIVTPNCNTGSSNRRCQADTGSCSGRPLEHQLEGIRAAGSFDNTLTELWREHSSLPSANTYNKLTIGWSIQIQSVLPNQNGQY